MAANASSHERNLLATVLARPLASLKLTVALFAMGIFIVLVGTLAQVDKDMWQVIDEYFRAWIARIELQVFFPKSWFPKSQNIAGAFWFPGGAMIGALMALNLVFAHVVRFRVQANGTKLASGAVILAIGTAITGAVIYSGHNYSGLQGEPPFSWQTLWTLVKVAVGLGCATCLYLALTVGDNRPDRVAERRLLWLATIGLGGIAVWLFLARENAYLGDAGMRILWQLIQATFCGLVLLPGCWLIFGKRGGVVLIHAGVGLMMFGQFFVSKYDVEEQMNLNEGETKTFAQDIRQTELAIVDASDPEEDHVTVVPRSLLMASLNHGSRPLFSRRPIEVNAQGIIRDPALPFDLQVLRYDRNADIRKLTEKDKADNLATAGSGKEFIAVPVKAASGASGDSPVDLAALYARLIKKDGSGDLGVFLLSQLMSFQDMAEQVEVDGKTYDLTLRFRRNYKPYQITLNDVRKDDYVGTSTPRNYSSDIRLQDKARGVDREIHIWMNNPLRYAGETFYQSGYQGPPDFPTESTTLSVVTNAGWMIPYVSCMIVFVGLGAHFGQVLLRFLRRRASLPAGEQGNEFEGTLIGLALTLLTKQRSSMVSVSKEAKKNIDRAAKSSDKSDWPLPSFAPSAEPLTVNRIVSAVLPLLLIAPFAALLAISIWSSDPAKGTIDLREFGRLPVIADGRVKPIDTLARNTLRVLSNRETFYDDQDQRLPAIQWLLDVMAHPEVGEKHRVLRIDNLEVLDLFQLERRKRHLYSIAELVKHGDKFEEQVTKARDDSKKNGAETLSVFQRKILELSRRIEAYRRIDAAFNPPALPELPTREEFDQDAAAAKRKIESFRDGYLMFTRMIEGIHAPLAVPTKPSKESVHQDQEQKWLPYSQAFWMAKIDVQLLGNQPPLPLKALTEVFIAYSEGNASKFNMAVADYRELLKRERPAELQTNASFWNRLVNSRYGNFYRFEEAFNYVAPFYFCWWPYLLAGVLAAGSWLGWSPPLRRAAFWLTAFSFLVHTLALGARIYISGRPPVTNLYSSAIFIGWAVVLFCMIWERIYRDGLATFVSSLLGFASLLIAHILAGDGDTFTVLQAVLDTQFWLATHVVTVTLGYASTFLAGSLGIVYIARGLFTSSLTSDANKELTRMIYGTTCFALFFSFIGTVLGGLWADDSWGRFWGWDPKENGALIIVMWNALILHARWDGMVKDRGLAVLAVGGNIVTSWSWFGVNELGVGLHAYGFTEGVLWTLAIFVISQGAIIVLGCLPRSLWRSFRATA